jgi:hypothetical protein
MQMLTIEMFLAWARAVTFWFIIFWNYLPFAMAARDLAELNRRYV